MVNRRIVLFLVTGLAILIVTLAVVLVFQSLFAALGDAATAGVLFGFGIACLVMLVVDVLLLVGALGMLAVQDLDDPHRGRGSAGEDRNGDSPSSR